MHAKKTGSVEELAVIGVDIGNETFHLVGFDRTGQLVMRKQIKRLALTATVEQFPRCIVGMEACLSPNFVSRTLRIMGFEPRIIPAIYVKPSTRARRTTTTTRRPSQKRPYGPTCGPFKRRIRISSISRPCIRSGHGWSLGARQRSTKSAPF